MKIRTWMAVAAGLTAGMAQAAFVTVGNPGNAPDTTTYGGVAYEYQINQFETTAGGVRGVSERSGPDWGERAWVVQLEYGQQ